MNLLLDNALEDFKSVKTEEESTRVPTRGEAPARPPEPKRFDPLGKARRGRKKKEKRPVDSRDVDRARVVLQ